MAEMFVLFAATFYVLLSFKLLRDLYRGLHPNPKVYIVLEIAVTALSILLMHIYIPFLLWTGLFLLAVHCLILWWDLLGIVFKKDLSLFRAKEKVPAKCFVKKSIMLYVVTYAMACWMLVFCVDTITRYEERDIWNGEYLLKKDHAAAQKHVCLTVDPKLSGYDICKYAVQLEYQGMEGRCEGLSQSDLDELKWTCDEMRKNAAKSKGTILSEK